MFWRKVFHVLVISILILGAITFPSIAKVNKALPKTSFGKSLATSYTVCASGCNFSSIQTAINSVVPGDTLNLAAEIFTESITIDKDLIIQGAGAESTIVQAAVSPGIATSRVVTVTTEISVTLQGLTIRYGNLNEGFGGGGIFNEGILQISDSTIENNSSFGSGGGILNRASLSISNSFIRHNQSTRDGGGIFSFAESAIRQSLP